MAGSGKGALRIAIEDFLETFKLHDVLSGWIEKILDKLEDENIKLYKSLVKHLGLDGKLPPGFEPDKFAVVVKTSQSGFFLSLGAIVGLALGGFFGVGQPIARLASQFVDKFYRSYRPSPAELWQLLRTYPELGDEVNKMMLDNGVPDVIIKAYEKAVQPILDHTALEVLRRKGSISDSEWERELSKLGWTNDRQKQIKALRDLIPGSGDLIRMAVREAFSPDVVARFGYAQDFPPEFADWMVKQGFSADWAKKYWYAHWELPSLMQGFEMLHRLRPGETSNPVTLDDIKTLLRIQDVAPFWRDRLTEISYNPLTRVDVRRMYGMGVLSEDEVYRNYRDIGYNEENARRMTEFTVRYERQTERGLTREAIQGSYKRGLIARDTAITQLGEVGYPDDIADFYLDIIDFDTAANQTDEKLSAIKAKYLAGALTNSTVIDELGRMNLPAERMNALLEVWQIQLDNKVNTASRSELDDFYRRGMIDTGEYIEYLKLDGYSAEMVGLFTRRIDSIVLEEAKIEAERAQREQERLRTARLASDYQRGKAGLDVTIAQARLAIADLKVAIHDLEEPADQADNKVRQDEIKAIIAAVQLEKAEQTYAYKTDRISGEV